MHVLFIAQQWEPELGVPPKRGRWMVDQLIARGHRVTVVAPPPHYPSGKLLSTRPEDQAGAVSQTPTGETVYRARFKPHSSRILSRVLDQAVVGTSSVSTALRAIRNDHPDVILATAPPLPAAFTAYVTARVRRIPFVIDLRDAWPELVPYVMTADPETRRLRSVAKKIAHPAFLFAGKVFGFVLSRADGIMTTSAWHGNSIRTTMNVPTETLANHILLDLTATSTRPKSTPSNKLRILYTGNVGRAQGLENAIEAVRIAANEGVELTLRIVGGGAHLAMIKELAADLPYVEFLSQSRREDLDVHHCWSDTLLVHLKDWLPLNETVPSKLFEAVASGRHVTLAANGESVELLEESGAGDAVPAMNPQALADLWVELARNRERLNVGSIGIDWLRKTQAAADPAETFVDFLDKARARRIA